MLSLVPSIAFSATEKPVSDAYKIFFAISVLEDSCLWSEFVIDISTDPHVMHLLVLPLQPLEGWPMTSTAIYDNDVITTLHCDCAVTGSQDIFSTLLVDYMHLEAFPYTRVSLLLTLGKILFDKVRTVQDRRYSP